MFWFGSTWKKYPRYNAKQNDTADVSQLTSDSKALRAVEEAPCWAGAKAAAEPMRARAASLNMVG